MADNQIQLSGDYIREEALASGTVSPGMLLELTSATADTVKAHATQGGEHERAFAVEDSLQGNEITDDYANGALVQYNIVQPGARVQALLKAGESVTKGDTLISGGDGTLIGDTGSPVQKTAIALETLDLSASGSSNTLMDVRVL